MERVHVLPKDDSRGGWAVEGSGKRRVDGPVVPAGCEALVRAVGITGSATADLFVSCHAHAWRRAASLPHVEDLSMDARVFEARMSLSRRKLHQDRSVPRRSTP